MQSVTGDSDAVGVGMVKAFTLLGIQGVQAIEQEVAKLQEALTQVRRPPDEQPGDKEAVVWR